MSLNMGFLLVRLVLIVVGADNCQLFRPPGLTPVPAGLCGAQTSGKVVSGVKYVRRHATQL